MAALSRNIEVDGAHAFDGLGRLVAVAAGALFMGAGEFKLFGPSEAAVDGMSVALG